MQTNRAILAAIAALALTAACGKEETRTSTAPLPPPISTPTPAPTQSADTMPSPQTGSTATPGAERTVGQTVDDATLTVKVKTALLDSPEVKGLQVNVDTLNGTVTLKGEVETQAQADRAVQIARNTEGVRKVDSELMVKGRS